MMNFNYTQRFYNQQKPSFSSNIIIVGNNKFDDLTCKDTMTIQENGIDGAEKIQTKGIFGCVAGLLANPKHLGLMIHSRPSGAFVSKEIKELFNSLIGEKYPDSQPQNFNGILVGGKFDPANHSNSPESIETANTLQNIFKTHSDGITKFLDQTKPRGFSNIFYDAQLDNLYINPRDEENPDNQIINSAEDLKQFYSKIEIRKGDHVFIDGQNDEPDNLAINRKFSAIPDCNTGITFDCTYYPPPSPTDDRGDTYLSAKIDKKTVNLFQGNYGEDKKTLWIDSEDPDAIRKIVKDIDLIKNSKMFSDIETISYAGKKAFTGFKKESSEDGEIYSGTIEEIKKANNPENNIPEWALKMMS